MNFGGNLADMSLLTLFSLTEFFDLLSPLCLTTLAAIADLGMNFWGELPYMALLLPSLFSVTAFVPLKAFFSLTEFVA